MQIHRQLTDLPSDATGGAVAIGNFDGVHKGHAVLVRRLVELAQEVEGPATVFTFDPHPVRLLRPAECPPPLTWTERKAELLEELGVDQVVAYPTDEALLRLSAREFFDLLLKDTLKARAIVEGPNFYFGHNREGDVGLLAQFAEEASMLFDIVVPSETNGELISSSRIRRLIGGSGDVASAAAMLTAPYRLRGIVTHGAGRGAKIGFPTANLEGIDTLLPADGVYAGVGWSRGHCWPAAINIGANPTFGETVRKVEVHLVGCDETIYGRRLVIDFLERLRGVETFDSQNELIYQIQQDVEAAERIASNYK